MKQCSKCKKTKQIKEFNFKKKSENLRHSECNVCTRFFVKNHYNKNKEYYIQKTQKRSHKLRSDILNYTKEYLSNNPCVDCGESDITVLEFDHNRDSFVKFKAVSSLIRARYPLEIIIEGIKKCEIRCANCHRRKTAKEFSWFKR